MKSTQIRIADGHINDVMSMTDGWFKDQWVMCYIFSDQSANKYGFGAFAPGVGSEYFEKSATGTFDLDTYAGSYKMRIGTRSDDSQPVSNLRKILLFKGTAIHSTSANTINDLLLSNSCLISRH